MSTVLYPYSFMPRLAEPANLAGFMRRVVSERPEFAERADWELPPERTPEHVTYQNFDVIFPINMEPCRIKEAGMELAAKLTAFCVRFLEKVAMHHIHNHDGAVPNAEQIMADLEKIVDEAVETPIHEVWKYSLALSHPIVHTAVTNAFNNRWNRSEPETDSEQYGLFFPPESEMIGVDFMAGRRAEHRRGRAASRPKRSGRR